MKKCRMCKQLLPFESFKPAKNKDGYTNYCHTCNIKHINELRAARKAKTNIKPADMLSFLSGVKLDKWQRCQLGEIAASVMVDKQEMSEEQKSHIEKIYLEYAK